MAVVKLRGTLNRYNKDGFIFERGVPVTVDLMRGRELSEDPRFEVIFDDKEFVQASTAPLVRKTLTEADKIQKIREAIDELSEENEDHWTVDGKPASQALSSIVGFVVSNELRDKAVRSATKAEPRSATTPIAGGLRIKRPAKAAELVDTGADAAQTAAQPVGAEVTEEGIEV